MGASGVAAEMAERLTCPPPHRDCASESTQPAWLLSRPEVSKRSGPLMQLCSEVNRRH